MVNITFCEKDRIIKLLDRIDELEKEKIGIKLYFDVGLGKAQIINNILELLKKWNYPELQTLHNKLLNGELRKNLISTKIVFYKKED